MNRHAPGLLAVLHREWQRLRADPWDLGMLTWIPLATCALLWWIFSAGVARELPIAVVDADHSSVSRQLTRMLDQSPGIRVIETGLDEANAMQLMRERHAFGVVLIPADLQRRMLAGRSATVQWVYNGQFSAHVGGLSRDVRAVVGTLSAGIELVAREKRGVSPVQAKAQFEPIQLRLSTLYNERGSYEPFLTLAVIPAMLQIFATLAAVVGIGRELKAGSVPDWLAAAGGRWGVALAGKLLIPAGCMLAGSLLFVLFFAGVRGWPVEGDGVALVLGLLLLNLACLGLGTLLIGAVLGLRTALSGAAFITAPAFAFSGQGFPLLGMPPLARAWADVLPLTHYLQLQSRCWLEGAALRDVAGPLGALLLYAALSFAAGLALLAWRAERPQAWGKA